MDEKEEGKGASNKSRWAAEGEGRKGEKKCRRTVG